MVEAFKEAVAKAVSKALAVVVVINVDEIILRLCKHV